MEKNSLSYFKNIGESTPLNELMEQARILRDQKGTPITFSKKVFIPLTMLCRDVCHYRTFAKVPRKLAHPYLRSNEVLDIAKKGELHQCKEALFTLGEKPELRYRAAKDDLKYLGYQSTIDYLYDMSRLVIEETGLLPHPRVKDPFGCRGHQKLCRAAPYRRPPTDKMLSKLFVTL